MNLKTIVPPAFPGAASSLTRSVWAESGTDGWAGCERMIWHYLSVNVKYVRAFWSTSLVHGIYAAFFIAMPSGRAQSAARKCKKGSPFGEPFSLRTPRHEGARTRTN